MTAAGQKRSELVMEGRKAGKLTHRFGLKLLAVPTCRYTGIQDLNLHRSTPDGCRPQPTIFNSRIQPLSKTLSLPAPKIKP